MLTLLSASPLVHTSLAETRNTGLSRRLREQLKLIPKEQEVRRQQAGKGLHIRGNYTRYANAASCPVPPHIPGWSSPRRRGTSSPARRAPHSRSEIIDMETHTNHHLNTILSAIPTRGPASRDEPHTAEHDLIWRHPRLTVHGPTLHHSQPGHGPLRPSLLTAAAQPTSGQRRPSLAHHWA